MTKAHPLTASAQTAGYDTRLEPSLATASDYFALLKPRVMSLVIFTALVGLVIAPGSLHPLIGFTAILCIALGAGAAGALNMWYEADIDALMKRTAKRPLPSGRIAREDAFAFAIVLAVFSVVTMGLAVNLPAAGLLAFTIFFYAVVYTIWLKRSTPQNIVIGGAAGAFPPMIGWMAATGNLGIEPLLLFCMIFFWTPPHFWSLALVSSNDYARAGIPMLPVVAGSRKTRQQIVIYTAILLPIGLSPFLAGFAGLLYAGLAVIAGGIMLRQALRLQRANETQMARAAKSLFGLSILYLFSLFAALLIEHRFDLAFGRWIG